jgi:mono/diheme cytochrome c family protein
MKKIAIITGVIFLIVMTSCRFSNRSAGHYYMPDMTYSRAYETYAELDSSKFTNDTAKSGGMIYYDRSPVAGTVARGEVSSFLLPMDKGTDTTNYIASKSIINPLPPLSAVDSVEAARLYLVNCGICHGDKLDGNGPLYNDGNGPFAAKPKNLVSDPTTVGMPEGQMFYSVTYGKNAMGSYASQLTTKQRWMVIHFVKGQQAKATAKAPAAPAADSTGKAKK